MQQIEPIWKKFVEIGADADIADRRARVTASTSRWNRTPENSFVDVRGKRFVLRLAEKAHAIVLDAKPKEKHLLLMIKEGGEKYRYLCGQDEKGWFAAAVPGVAKTVAEAMENLQPKVVRELHDRAGSTKKERFNRRSKVVKRQGEWFFIPMPAAFHKHVNDELAVLQDEPIQRGGSRAHFCEYLARKGGERVYVTKEYPNGLTRAQFERACADGRISPASRIHARQMQRGARVFVKGRITANDHATLILPTWHEVIPNTEDRAPGRQYMAFLD
jgi:hypothetical protein